MMGGGVPPYHDPLHCTMVWAVVVMGVVMLLMLLIMGFLIYVITNRNSMRYKLVKNENKISMHAEEVKINENDESFKTHPKESYKETYEKDCSNKDNTSNNLLSKEKKIANQTAKYDAESKEKKIANQTAKCDAKTQTETESDVTSSSNSIKSTKQIQNNNLRYKLPVMMPEDINRIIKGTLKKTAMSDSKAESMKDINQKLEEIKIDDEIASVGMMQKDKSISTPVLDVYDVLPPPITLDEFDHQAVYESVPCENKSFVIKDKDTHYLLPFAEGQTEYENANNVD